MLMNYTTEEKYDWLLSHIRVGGVDVWEKDAMIFLSECFQFNNEFELTNIDKCVQLAMNES